MATNESIIKAAARLNAEFRGLYAKYQNGSISPVDQAQLLAAGEQLVSLSNDVLQVTEELVQDIAQLRYKAAHYPEAWTQADAATLLQKMQELEDRENILTVDNGASLAETLAAIKQQMSNNTVSGESATTAAGYVTLTFDQVTDYYDFIVKTQYLNPYRRNRACDDAAKDLILTISDITKENVSRIKEQLDFAKKQLS